uniref:Formin homology 2 domain containing 3a n=1 Tax=Esox lucius TaxID=8010 RepID=A0A6Q2X6W1_ESOLU
MATFVCRVQFLDDTDPFNSTNFPEPTRPPHYTFREDIPLINQIAGVHRLLRAPHKLDDCALQLSHNGTYLDLESSLAEQRDELEGFQEDMAGGKKHSLVLRTQLTVRVHACIEKLYNSNGRDLRRALFSLKQIFQDDKDLVHEFVMAEGLTCLIKVGTEADQNYQNYILRALGQIMLYVDGMNGVINHIETIQWLYALIGSKFRLVVKTALKLLLVFVEYSESNAPLLIEAISTVDTKRGCTRWSNAMEILAEKDGVDTELLVYTTTLINKTLSALPDQDSFYDMVDVLEEQGMEGVAKRFLGRRGTDLDLMEQLNIYEATLRHEDGDEDCLPPPGISGRKVNLGGGNKRKGLERRRSRRASLGRSGNASPCSPSPQRSRFQRLSLCYLLHTACLSVSLLSHSHCMSVSLLCYSLCMSVCLFVVSFASRNSTVTVPASKEVTHRGIQHPSPQRLPYLPQSPFHLFSYDLNDEQSSPATKQEVDFKAASARLGAPPRGLPALGGLISSSYRQHQESLAAERERRRAEREERLQRIEREERNKHNRDYVDKMEEARMARDERYKHVERLAAEEFERDRVPRSRPDLSLNFDPAEAWHPTSSCSPTPSSSVASQDEEPDGEPEGPDTEPEEECGKGTTEEEAPPEKGEREEEEQEDSGILSDKERQNEEVNEKDNCSASSISSASSTLEREERGKITETGLSCLVKDVAVNEQCSNILHSKLFMLDMLYSQSPKPCADEEGEEGGQEKGEEGEAKLEASQPPGEGEQDENAQKNVSPEKHPEKIGSNLNVRAFAERFGDLVKGLGSPPTPLDSPPYEADVEIEKPPPLPPKKESDTIWDQLLASPRELRIRDIDFTDLKEEDDRDLLDVGLMGGSDSLCHPPPPTPQPLLGLPPPPPFSTALPSQPLFQKKKKTIKLFWSEVHPSDSQYIGSRSSGDSLWSKLEPVRIDTSKLEHLFETKSKEIPVTKKTAADGKRQEVIVLDSKRSNSINIGLTVLPPPRTIKTAILNFDEYALNKEGIEKILTMVPTEEEKQKIQEAQLANPDIPLGSAEQFLLILSSISELSARLQLWAFKMDYEVTEKEVAEPLQDLKEGMEQLQKNKTLRYILSTLLAIGNFLNSTNAKGFELSYLEKVPEVKDTVHKQSLLHHACSIVVDNYPQSTDLYSEIGAITRSAKVDFDQLQENLALMERRCKASWDHLKVIAKHEMKPTLKQKMSDFLKDCAERIIILKIVHRRIINRFHAFLLYLGHPAYSIREISVHRFSKIISEFALEYRTTRDRVLQQKQKRADHRERNKTRGKMIMDSTGRCNAGSSSSAPSGVVECVQPQGLGHAEDAAEHEFMKAVLKTSLQGGDREVSGAWTPTMVVGPESQRSGDDEADEIMERIVRSATQGPSQRAVPRERRRSRANRKSLRRTLKSGLTPEEALLLGLSEGSEMPV